MRDTLILHIIDEKLMVFTLIIYHPFYGNEKYELTIQLKFIYLRYFFFFFYKETSNLKNISKHLNRGFNYFFFIRGAFLFVLL